MRGNVSDTNNLNLALSNKALNPRHFLPDERQYSDLLTFINRLSKKIQYYNLQNKPDGNWYEFFVSDEIFLLAEIDNFPLSQLEKQRVNAMISFENQNVLGEKQQIIQQFYRTILLLLQRMNEWYSISSRYNKNKEASAIENELTAAIEFTGQDALNRLKAIYAGTVDEKNKALFEFDESPFLAIWNLSKSIVPENILGNSSGKDALSLALKQLLLIYKPVYKTMSTLMVRARTILQQSLHHQSDHQPHIGLILTFLDLYKYAQQDLNAIPERQLEFYLHKILGQKKRPQISDRMYCVFDISPDIKELLLPKGSRILAGQNEQGNDRIYISERDVLLNHARLSSIHTLFVSRNPLIDQNSRYQLVSGIYQKQIDPEFSDRHSIATLGEEQRFFLDEEKTMEEGKIGFAIVSNALKLQAGYREILLTFQFTEQSFHYLTTVLMDIAAKREIKPDEAFYAVFSQSVFPEFTAEEGWLPFSQVDMVPPEDWSLRQFSMRMILSKSMPAMVPYNEDIHAQGWNVQQPAIRILLKGSNTYHPYSHLYFLDLDQITIDVEVEALKQFHLLTNSGAVDDTAPFELFGASPRKESYLLIGNEELFCKQLTRLDAGWDYFSLPTGDQGLGGYYAAYPYPMGNENFTFSVRALTDFGFYPSKDDRVQRYRLFDYDDANGPVHTSRVIKDIDLSLLKIQPNATLTLEDLQEYTPRLETGFLKFELDSPEVGFGYEVYSSVYNATVSQATDLKTARSAGHLHIQAPNEPFSPLAQNFFINYHAQSQLIFNGRRAIENNKQDDNTFIHIHPFGSHPVYEKSTPIGSRLVPYFELEGSIYLGFEDLNANELLNMLWELVPNDKWTYGEGAEVKWHYLSKNEWMPLKGQYLLFDETNGLINSGIISIEIPPDASKEHISLPSGKIWLRAGVSQKAELVSRLKRIYLSAASAIYQFPPEGEENHPISLEAFSAEAVADNIDGILSVIQPLPTSGGRAKETEGEFISRISEYLRHKQRAITTWDMEKMLLREFDQLAYVRAFGHFGHESFVAPGEVVIAAMPKIYNTEVFFQPKLNFGEIKAMEEYLRKVSSPFAKITVRNPLFEFVWVKCKVVLKSKETGAILKQLHKDLLHYLCPWFYEDPKMAMTIRTLRRSDVYMYLQSRPYISYITGFSLVHLTVDDQGKYHIEDTAQTNNLNDEIICTRPWTVIVPLAGNHIEIMQEAEYTEPEPTHFEDMIIGSNLVIGGGLTPQAEEEKVKDLIPEKEKPKPSIYSFTLKL